MEPNTNPQAQMEMLRRRSQQTGSSVGVGADQANSMSPSNPLSAQGPGMMTNPMPSGGAAGFPTAGAQQQLKQEKSESTLILETMKNRLKVLGERGQ